MGTILSKRLVTWALPGLWRWYCETSKLQDSFQCRLKRRAARFVIQDESPLLALLVLCLLCLRILTRK